VNTAVGELGHLLATADNDSVVGLHLSSYIIEGGFYSCGNLLFCFKKKRVAALLIIYLSSKQNRPFSVLQVRWIAGWLRQTLQVEQTP
jgi:hypothetical protein